jgi:hypothetical protein
MTWGLKLMAAYTCVATGVFSGVLAHTVLSTTLGIKSPLFCPLWEKGYCTECKRTIRGGAELQIEDSKLKEKASHARH